MKRTMLSAAACVCVLLAAGTGKASAETLSAAKDPAASDLKGPIVQARDKWCREIGSGILECESCLEDEVKQMSHCTIAIEYRDP